MIIFLYLKKIVQYCSVVNLTVDVHTNKLIVGCIYLQLTRLAVASARSNFYKPL